MNVATQLVDQLMTATPASSQTTASTKETGKSNEFENLIREKTQVSEPAAKDAPTKEVAAAPANEEVTELQQELAAALITSQPAVPVNVLEVQTTAPAFDPAAQTAITLEAQSTVEVPAVRTELQQAAQPVIEQTPQTQTQPQQQVEAPDTAPVQTAQANTQPDASSENSAFSADTAPTEQSFTVEKKESSTTETPVFENIEAVPVKVAEAAPTEKTAPVVYIEQPQSAEKLSEQISDSILNGESKLEIKLSPENLGDLTVEITRTDDGSLGIVLKTTSDKAAGILQQQASGLQSILAAGTQGPVKIEVQNQTQQSPEQFLNPDREGQQQNGQQPQQQNEQQHNPSQQQTQDFIQQLRLGLVDLSQPA